MSENQRVFVGCISLVVIAVVMVLVLATPWWIEPLAIAIHGEADYPTVCGSSCQYQVQYHLYAHECIEGNFTDIDLCLWFIEEKYGE